MLERISGSPLRDHVTQLARLSDISRQTKPFEKPF
jgi:hypothetical protein